MGDATERRTLRNPTTSIRDAQPTTKTKVGAAAHKAGAAAQVVLPSHAAAVPRCRPTQPPLLTAARLVGRFPTP